MLHQLDEMLGLEEPLRKKSTLQMIGLQQPLQKKSTTNMPGLQKKGAFDFRDLPGLQRKEAYDFQVDKPGLAYNEKKDSMTLDDALIRWHMKKSPEDPEVIIGRYESHQTVDSMFQTKAQ